jgi:hypothetical protein
MISDIARSSENIEILSQQLRCFEQGLTELLEKLERAEVERWNDGANGRVRRMLLKASDPQQVFQGHHWSPPGRFSVHPQYAKRIDPLVGIYPGILSLTSRLE